MTRTYKREVAAFVLAYCLGMFTWGASGNESAIKVAETILPWAVILVIGAFGFEAVTQQLLPTIRGGK